MTAETACVVFDTNPILPDFRLSGLSWTVLAREAADGKVVPCFPAVVVDELVAKESDARRKAIERVRSAGAFLADGDLVKDVIVALEAEQDVYPQQLLERIQALGGEVLDYPDIDHADLVRRALDRRPPFDSNGDGYRDTLIWLSALDAVEAMGGDNLILVSEDSAFKSKSDGTLHPALVDEAAKRGFGAQLVGGVTTLFRDHSSTGNDLSELVTLLKQESLCDHLAEELYEQAADAVLDAEALALPRSAREIAINYVEDVREVTTVPVRKLDAGRGVYSYTALVDAELEMVVSEWDAEWCDMEVRERYRLDDVRARLVKPLQVEGLVTVTDFGTVVESEATSWSAPEADPLHVLYDDPCGCMPQLGRRPGR